MLKKLLISVLHNWKNKYKKLKGELLYINKIIVNQGKTIKRIRPVPQGRGHKIRKRSSIIVIFLENRKQ